MKKVEEHSSEMYNYDFPQAAFRQWAGQEKLRSHPGYC
jgi:hypothetical protein